MRIIDVPVVEKEAYNPDRPISGLIQMQLIHLSTAEQTLPPGQRTGTNISTLHSEGQAAEYIQKVTAMLHKVGKAKKKKSTGNQARPINQSRPVRQPKPASRAKPEKSRRRNQAKAARP
jgi:hypothetical protein